MQVRDPNGYFGLNWDTPNPVNVLCLLLHLIVIIPLFVWGGLWAFWFLNEVLPWPVFS